MDNEQKKYPYAPPEVLDALVQTIIERGNLVWKNKLNITTEITEESTDDEIATAKSIYDIIQAALSGGGGGGSSGDDDNIVNIGGYQVLFGSFIPNYLSQGPVTVENFKKAKTAVSFTRSFKSPPVVLFTPGMNDQMESDGYNSVYQFLQMTNDFLLDVTNDGFIHWQAVINSNQYDSTWINKKPIYWLAIGKGAEE